MCECENFLGPMKFKFLFIFLALTAKCMFANGQSCDMAAPDNTLLNWDNNAVTYIKKDGNLKDNATLKMAFKLQGTGGTLAFPSITDGTAKKYITATVVDQQLNLETNEQFAQYDEDQPKQVDPLASKNVVVKFKCNDLDMALNVIMNIEDTNNHDPTFEKPSYVYTLPMPMVPKYDLTSLGDPIIAKDVDFSNQNIGFTITDPDSTFILDTESSADSKEYRAKLTVPEYTRFSKDTTFTLTATDSGNPTRSGTTQITIKVDDSSSLPDIPTFSKASYKFKYSIKDGIPAIDIQDGPMTVTTNNPEDIDVTFEEDSAKTYLNAAFNPDTKEVTITSTGTPVETTENILVFTLKIASKTKPDEKSDTVILIEIPKDNVIIVPQFSKAYYTATYLTETDPDSIKIDGEEISVSPITESVDVTLEGEKATKFNIKAVGDKWQLGVETALDPDDLKKGGDIILTLKAAVTGADAGKVDPGYATLVIQLPVVEPEVPPKFGQSHYIGNYKIVEADNDVVNLKENITVTSSEAVTVTFENSTYADYFNIIPDTSDPKTFILSVKNDLTSEILTKEAEILLTLQATSDQGTGTSAVVISLPKDINPKFSKPNYAAKYEVSTDGQGQVSVDGTITITSIDQEALTVTIQKSDYENYFGIDKDTDNPNNYKLVLKANLSQEILNKQEDIVLTLEAVLTGTVKGLSTVVISLPKAAIPTFSKPHYSAAYKVESNGNGSVTLNDGPIEITSPTGEAITVTILETDSNSDHFDITYNEEKKIYELSVKTPLDYETLIKEADIVLTLKATLVDNTPAEGTATLIIKLPKQVAPPSFSLPFYKAKYVQGTDQDEVQLSDGETINLNGDNIPETSVTLDAGDYADNFQISGDTSPYTITVKTKLAEDVLYTKNEIIVTLVAAFKDSSISTLTTKATVKIDLPGVPAAVTFLKPLYTGKYANDETATVTVEGDQIKTSSDSDSVVLTVGKPYDENFELIYDSGTNSYNVHVKQPLDSAVVDQETEILIDLDVETPHAVDHDKATLLLKMPEKTLDVLPEFSKISYVADYKIDGDTHTVVVNADRPIKIVSEHESETEVKVVDSYDSYFEPKRDTDGSYQIQVKKKLEDKILNTEKEIYVSLQASIPGNTRMGKAIIIVTLPINPDLKPTPTFSETYYNAEYKKDASIKLDKQINITSPKEYLDLIHVTFAPYNENFNIIRDGEDGIWNITVNKPLEQAVIDANSEITIELTATLDKSISAGTATLIIKLPNKEIVSFDKPSYVANYTVNLSGTDAITIDEITVTPSDAKVIVEEDYQTNFVVDCKAGKCTLTVKEDLSQDILSKETRIAVTIQATKEHAIGAGTAAIIIALPLLNVKPTPKFTKTYYTAEYTVDNTSITVNDAIKIDSAFEESVQVSLTSYGDNFQISRDSELKQWNIKVVHPLDSETLLSNTEITIELMGHLDAAAADAFATLLVKLPEKAVIQFDKPYYTANYTTGTAKDSVESEPIAINVEGVTLTTDGEYKDYFKAQCDQDKKCELEVQKSIPDDILESKTEILLVLVASMTGITQKGKSTVIIKLPDQDEDETPEFSKDVYTANYIKQDDDTVKVILDDDDQITIKNISDAQVTVNVAGEYSSNFEAVFNKDKDHWELNVIQKLSDDKLNTDIAILVHLEASAASSSSKGKAAVVIKLPKQIHPTSIVFTDNVYMAQYYKDNNSISIDNKIAIEGDSEGNATVTLDKNDEYAKYFLLSYKNEIVTVTMNKEKTLPDDVLKDEVAISVDIKAIKGNDTITTTLVVKLPDVTDDDDNDCDTSGLIAGIAVLAVLLVAAIVGSAVFYYIKFRKSSTYENMDDPISHSERFKRNSNTGTKNKFEHPTRRPTGVIKYPIDTADPDGETATEEEFPEKRKSVQFDTVNIDELEIEPEKSDDDVMYDDVNEYSKNDSDDEDDQNSSQS